MASIKVPSTLELLRYKFLSSFWFYKEKQKQTFWKEQIIRSGFDIRHLQDKSVSWQSVFYEQLFLHKYKASDKYFWKKHGVHVQKLELTGIGVQEFESILTWFPNIKHLILKKCNTLLLHDTTLQSHKNIKTLEIHDTHLLTEKSFASIPQHIKELVIHSTRSITDAFFDQLHTLANLECLSLINCHSLTLHQLSKLPQNIGALNLSGSGANIMPDPCFYLPRTLHTLSMKRWDHFGDSELTLLPTKLQFLDIEGWDVTASGMKHLTHMPLSALYMARISCTDFYSGLKYLPRSLKKLSLSQNQISAYDLRDISSFTSLVELDISYLEAFGGTLDDTPLHFAPSIKRLDCSYSGPLHTATIHSLTTLRHLTHFNAAGCSLENADLEYLPQTVSELDISLAYKITDAGFTFLGKLQKLCNLHLEGCDQIRGSGLSHLSQTVKKLSLAGCHRLSGKSLAHIPRQLEELSVDSCELVMLEDITTMPRLHTICLQGCPNITQTATTKLVGKI